MKKSRKKLKPTHLKKEIFHYLILFLPRNLKKLKTLNEKLNHKLHLKKIHLNVELNGSKRIPQYLY